MKILHYMPFIDKNQGGVPAYMDLLSRDLGLLCELHIITHYSPSDYQLENCTVHYMPSNWCLGYRCKQSFISLLCDINPDIFHTNACWDPLTAMTAIWAKELGFRVVYTPHGELSKYSFHRHWWKKIPAVILWQKRGIESADLIHTTSELEKKYLNKLSWNSKYYLIPNCVKIDKIKIKRAWNKTNRILFLGRIHHKKGVKYLVDAVDILRKDLDGYEVDIVGSGDDNFIELIKKKIQDKGLQTIIKVQGPVFDEDKWEMYKRADLFVLPTLSENFGIVIAEALACGTPVITTKGAPWEDINENKCGWWVDIGVAPLVNAFKEFLNLGKSDLECMGLSGRKLIEEKYSSKNVATQFIEMYKSLL